MVVRTPFFGGFDVSRSTNVSDNRCVNLFPEIVDTKQGKDIGALYLTPGLDLLVNVGTGPIRGSIQSGPLLFVVSGDTFYSLDQFYASTLLGVVGATGAVSMIENGTQVAVFVGGFAFGWSQASGFVPITLPYGPVPPLLSISATYQDGFGIINQPGTSLIFQSNLLDLFTWDPLNFGDASGDPDLVVAVQQIHREIFVVKERHTEVWVNAGTPGFAFARLDGVYVEAGIIALQSIVVSGETLIWLGRNRSGEGVVIQLTGYQANRISTHALESIIQTYPQIDDAIAYSYQQDGHQFYVLSLPIGNATWVYDQTESAMAGVPIWHQRAALSAGVLNRHWGQTHTLYNGLVVIGDYRNGNLYAFDTGQLLDNGTQRKWLRSWRATGKPIDDPVRFSSLRLDMQTGINVPSGTDPIAVLRWSDDGGHTWSNEKYAHAGKTGETALRVKWNRLGSTRRNSGLDRIFEVSSTDVMPAAIIGAVLE